MKLEKAKNKRMMENIARQAQAHTEFLKNEQRKLQRHLRREQELEERRK